MNIRFIKNAITFFVLILSFSCSTVKVQKPAEFYQPQKLTPKPSVLNFTINTDIKSIETDINKSLSGLIMEDNSLTNNGGDNVMFKAWKYSDIKLGMEGNVLSYKVPLKTWIKAGFNVSKFGITLQDYRELNAAIALKMKTTVTLNQDWTVTTKTTSEGYEWLLTPTVKIAGIDFSVKFIADIILQASLKKMGPLVDKSVKEYLNFRPYAEEGWKTINQPLVVDKAHNVILNITPDKIISTNISADKGKLKHHAGMTGTILITMGNQDSIIKESANNLRPLPDITVGKIPNELTTIHAYFTLPFTELNSKATEYLKGKEFKQGNKHVTVENIRIYGSEGALIAETTLSGSLKGTIYFKGIPAFNADDSTLVVNNFDYELSTKNFLVKSASWLYQEHFRKMIANELSWSISKEMKTIRKTINENLKNVELSKGIFLDGKVDKLYPGTIYITSEGIEPEIIASGKINMNIQAIVF